MINDDDINNLINTDARKEDDNFLEKVCDKLMSRFDSCQIFVTRYMPNQKESISCSDGRGEWYTRIGFIKDWVIRQDEYTRSDVMKSGEN